MRKSLPKRIFHILYILFCFLLFMQSNVFMSLVFAMNKYLHTSASYVRLIILFLGCQSNKELSYVDCTIEESFPKHCCFRGLLIHSCLCLGCSRSRIYITLILESVTFCVLNTGMGGVLSIPDICHRHHRECLCKKNCPV